MNRKITTFAAALLLVCSVLVAPAALAGGPMAGGSPDDGPIATTTDDGTPDGNGEHSPLGDPDGLTATPTPGFDLGDWFLEALLNVLRGIV